MLRFFQLSLLVFLVGCLPIDTFAQDGSSKNREDSVADTKQEPKQNKNEREKAGKKTLETFEEIKNDFTKKMRAYSKRYRAAPTKAEKLEEFKKRPTPKPYRAKLTELINKAPTSDESQQVIDWWYRLGRHGDDAKIVLQLVSKHFSKSKLIKKHVYKIPVHFSKTEAEKQLRSLVEVNPSDSVKASATYHLRELLVKSVKEQEGEKAKKVQAEITSLKGLLMTTYVDEVNIQGVKFSALYEAEAFASKLEIGKPVPDIVGKDLDGVEFKLSEYRGKVTMISFWGNW